MKLRLKTVKMNTSNQVVKSQVIETMTLAAAKSHAYMGHRVYIDGYRKTWGTLSDMHEKQSGDGVTYELVSIDNVPENAVVSIIKLKTIKVPVS